MDMDIYKEFLYEIRRIECETPYISIISENPGTYLKRYVKMIMDIPYDEKTYTAFYGEIKRVIRSFFQYIVVIIGHACKQVEAYSPYLEFEVIMDFFDKTIETQEANQEEFIKEFQPIETDEDKQRLDRIQVQYQDTKRKLLDIGEYLVSMRRKPEKIFSFSKTHFPICVQKTHDLCDFAHLFLAKMIAERIPQLRTSIEETAQRIRNNLQQFEEKYQKKLKELFNELYDLQKESLNISRNFYSGMDFTESVEVAKAIKVLRNKIKTFGNYQTFERLNKEDKHWTQRMKEFEKVTTPVLKIKHFLEKMSADQKLHDQFKSTAPPGTRPCCWNTNAEKRKQVKEHLESKYTYACRSLITFFSSRGTDYILRTDDPRGIGTFIHDDYGHRNYIAQYGVQLYHHIRRDEFAAVSEKDHYYFDEFGRYIMENGKKVYQVAPCTSKYNISDDGQFHKTANAYDSEEDVPELKDAEILPKTKIIDIKKTLDTETVNYLWETFGWILPEVLNDLCNERPTNPIHYFGHLLLNKKNKCTHKELKENMREARQYREDVLQRRKDRNAALTRAWKAKMPKPCKPEDFDTTPQDIAYSAYHSDNAYTADISRYYNDNSYIQTYLPSYVYVDDDD